MLIILTSCGSREKVGDELLASPTAAAAGINNNGQTPTREETVAPGFAPQLTIEEGLVKGIVELVLADAMPSEIIKYVDTHIENSTQQEADNMVLILESVQKAWLEYYQNTIKYGEDMSITDNNKFIDEVTLNGYIMNTLDTSKVLVIDYDIYGRWENMLSDWFQEYIHIIRAEINNPAVINNELAVSLDELENRLLKASEYISEYPHSIRINEVIDLYDTYLYSYLYGYENNPVIDFDTKKFSMVYFNRYREFAERNHPSEAAALIFEYAAAIQKNGYILTNDIEQFLVDVFSDIDDKHTVIWNDIGRKVLTQRIGKLLPEKTGFTWECLGYADYTHSVKLDEIHTEDGNPVYTVNGKVKTLPDGEIPGAEAEIHMQYRIDNNVLTLTKTAPLMADSKFDKLEIIRYPFVVGNRWIQYSQDGGLNKVSVETEIVSITQIDGVNVYEVEYRDMVSGDIENRLIQTGKGTIGFTGLYSDGERETYATGYVIDKAKSGYVQ